MSMPKALKISPIQSTSLNLIKTCQHVIILYIWFHFSLKLLNQNVHQIHVLACVDIYRIKSCIWEKEIVFSLNYHDNEGLLIPPKGHYFLWFEWQSVVIARMLSLFSHCPFYKVHYISSPIWTSLMEMKILQS